MTKPTEAETWMPIGEVLGRLAAKLAAQRNRNAAVPIGGESTAARFPGACKAAPVKTAAGVENTLTAGQADEARMNGVALRGEDAGGIRRAAGRVRINTKHASLGNE